MGYGYQNLSHGILHAGIPCFTQCVDFVFTDIEFINNLNISAVKIGDKNTIDVRIVILI
jgi:hypothetical protein